MSKDLLHFCPVDNGDNSLITLKDGTTIQIDCNIRKSSEGSDTEPFDVKEFLLKNYRKGRRYLNDLFILTHPDKDHCRGFEGNYYMDDPEDYSEDSYQDGKIIIGELWVTTKIFTYKLSEDAKAIRREVWRRIRLIRENSPKSQLEGNRLVIIGYDDDEDRSDIRHYYPGETTNIINSKVIPDFEVFFHAPFKKELVDKSSDDRNNKSVVMQLTFNKGVNQKTALFGGDADHHIWREILKQTTEVRNNQDRLNWDFFLAPHHCSWTYFNDTKYEDNPDPTESSLEILDNYGQNNGYVIASSKLIKKNTDNPPHWASKREYEKHLPLNGTFLNTAEEYEKNDKQISFEIESSGTINRIDNKEQHGLGGIHVAGGTGYTAAKTPAIHG